MPSTCGVCNCDVSNCKSSEVISCNGDCKSVFHLECVKGEIEEKKTRAGKLWKCKDCRSTALSQHSSASGVSTTVTKDFILKVLEGFKSEVFAELKNSRTENVELTKSLNFLSDKVDTSNSLMEELKREFKLMKKENEELRSKNASLSRTVSELQDRVRQLDQYSRRNNVEISGIPVTPREDILSIVKDVGAAIGVKVEEHEVSAAHRVPSYRKDRPPSLVVQFNCRMARDTWITKFKENKESATADKVNASFPKHKFYVNEHLSPANKIFLSKLKKKAKEADYTYVWAREGKFFIRKANGEKCRRIDNESDIDSLK